MTRAPQHIQRWHEPRPRLGRGAAFAADRHATVVDDINGTRAGSLGRA